MKRAYVDTSVLVGMHFHEPGARALRKRLGAFDELISTTLVVAEIIAVLRREGRSVHEADMLLSGVSVFVPDGTLRAECEEAAAVRPLRGADLWHLASALALAGRKQRKVLTFITLDGNQAAAAATLGFRT